MFQFGIIMRPYDVKENFAVWNTYNLTTYNLIILYKKLYAYVQKYVIIIKKP